MLRRVIHHSPICALLKATKTTQLRYVLGLSDCAREAERQLTYDIPSRGFEKRAREILRLGPSQSLIACVDKGGKILRVVISEVH